MLRRFSISILLFALIPFPSFAQEDQSPTQGYCPTLTSDLQRGDRDANTSGQVTQLQQFLSDYYDLKPEDYVTGYFGRLTQQNVMRFQTEQYISPASGYVGPITRAAIKKVCAGGVAYAESSYYTQASYGTQVGDSVAKPSCSIAANPATVQSGGFAVLSWVSVNANSAILDQGIGAVSLSGTQFVTNVTNTTTYTMTVSGQGGVASCKTKLTVTSSYAQSSYYSQSTYYSQGSYGGQISQCVYGGVTYDSGYAAPNVPGGPEPGQYGWNSGYLYVCNAGTWQWKQCGWPNLTGPFPNTHPTPTKQGDGRFYTCP